MNSESIPASKPSRLAIGLRGLRAPFLVASGIPVLVGAGAAFHVAGVFSLTRFLLSLGGVLCLHLGANVANDYFDFVTGCDQMNPEPTPFSGGSRLIQSGLVSSRATLMASLTFLGLGALQGLWLNRLVPGNSVLLLGLAGIGGGLLYSAVPVKLSYRGLGEIVIFALFGPLVVAGSYLVQTGRLAVFPLLASLPCGLLVLAILLVNEVLDVKWDGLAGKCTLVVRLGQRRGYYLYLACYIAAYGWIVAGAVARIYGPLALVGLLPAVVSARDLRPSRALAERSRTVAASARTVMSHTVTGMVIAASYLVS
jgi:1,4-dihydroxy-2-naphthoate octaprenyltransferase